MRVLLVLTLVLAGAAPTAHADPVFLTGHITNSAGRGSSSLSGGGMSVFANHPNSFLKCNWCFEPFGAVVNPSMDTTLFARVAGVVNGREYPEEEDDFGEIVGPLALSGDLSISAGSAPLPPLGRELEEAIVRVPFTLSGSLTIQGRGEKWDEDVEGRGFVDVFFSGVSDEPGGPTTSWRWEAVTYNLVDSQPVPEPGTILLLGLSGGAAGLVARGRRIRRER